MMHSSLSFSQHPYDTLQALNFRVLFPSQFTESSTTTQETALQGRKHFTVCLDNKMNMMTKSFPLLSDRLCVSFQMPHCQTDNKITETGRLA